jgi:hypothetical protein
MSLLNRVQVETNRFWRNVKSTRRTFKDGTYMNRMCDGGRWRVHKGSSAKYTETRTGRRNKPKACDEWKSCSVLSRIIFNVLQNHSQRFSCPLR